MLILGLAVLAAVTQQQPADPHRTFTVGTATARRGETGFGALAVPAGVDSGGSIPVAVVHGASPGPVLALIAGSHGTEYASILALQKLIATLDARRIRGTVIIVPLVNVPSFEQRVPHLNPVDRKNMNRFYPGNPEGTQTERASYLITREIVEHSDHLIDLHGGDLDEPSHGAESWGSSVDSELPLRWNSRPGDSRLPGLWALLRFHRSRASGDVESAAETKHQSDLR